MGWERKRGKLEMLLRLLAAGDASGFVPEAGGSTLAPSIAYVMTLDSDTGLPPGALRELVAVARRHGTRIVGPGSPGVLNTAPGVALNVATSRLILTHGNLGESAAGTVITRSWPSSQCASRISI